MPEYDFRCEACAHRFSRRFKTYAMYDSAMLRCPQCESADLSRLISQVAIPKSRRDYRGMSSQEMLSVLESGASSQVDEMFQQVRGVASADQEPAARKSSASDANAT
jgi:putative FmdB family regulatory protein